MTDAAARIRSEVEQLSGSERTELRRAIIERNPISDDLVEDDFGAQAAELCRALNSADSPRPSAPLAKR